MDWISYLPQFGVFAPTMGLAWWIIRNKDRDLKDAQLRNQTLNDKMLETNVNLTKALTELTAYIRGGNR